MNNSNLFSTIREFVKRIPKGKVITYGDVAKAVGIRDARKVGWALHGNTDPDIPCHRVVKKDGFLAVSYTSKKDPITKSREHVLACNFVGNDEQRLLLKKEGVKFIGEYQVDLERHRWLI